MPLLHLYLAGFKYKRSISILYLVSFRLGYVSEVEECCRRQHPLWRDQSYLKRYSVTMHNHHRESSHGMNNWNNSPFGCSASCTCQISRTDDTSKSCSGYTFNKKSKPSDVRSSLGERVMITKSGLSAEKSLGIRNFLIFTGNKFGTFNARRLRLHFNRS